jgi:hypothetical protein
MVEQIEGSENTSYIVYTIRRIPKYSVHNYQTRQFRIACAFLNELDNTVCRARGYSLDGRGSIPRWGKRFFCTQCQDWL